MRQRILNSLCQARDWTWVSALPRCRLPCCITVGTPGHRSLTPMFHVLPWSFQIPCWKCPRDGFCHPHTAEGFSHSPFICVGSNKSRFLKFKEPDANISDTKWEVAKKRPKEERRKLGCLHGYQGTAGPWQGETPPRATWRSWWSAAECLIELMPWDSSQGPLSLQVPNKVKQQHTLTVQVGTWVLAFMSFTPWHWSHLCSYWKDVSSLHRQGSVLFGFVTLASL